MLLNKYFHNLISLLFFLIAFALVAILAPIMAHSFEIQAKGYQAYIESEHADPGRGVLVTAGKTFKVGVSYEETLLRFVGQELADVELWGFLGGIETEVMDNLFLSIMVGYYQPSITTKGEAFREAMWLEINDIYPAGWRSSYISQDAYSYDLHGNFGGLASLSYRYNLNEQVAIGLGVGYRYLKLEEHLVRDHRAYCKNSWVEFVRWQDFSGVYVAVNFSWRF